MWNQILKHRVLSTFFLLSLALVLGGTIWAYVSLHASLQSLILQFSEYSGITRVGGVRNLIGLGVFGIILVLANFLLALTLEDRNPVLARILTGATVFAAILIFIALSAIISVN